MKTDNVLDRIPLALLFPPRKNTYFLLDGASCPDFIPQSRKHKPDHVCLYRGELDAEMQFVAPNLIELKKDHPFTQWILDNSFGKHWGVFAITSASLVDVRKHFRSLTMVDGPSRPPASRDISPSVDVSPEGKPIYFRFYDPRVLNDFLPTCTPSELARIFGPVDYFLCEHIDEDKKKSEMIQHDAPTGATATPGVLRIRQAQMEEMGKKHELKTIRALTTEMRQSLPKQTKSFDDAALFSFVEKGVQEAKSYGISGVRDVADYVSYMLIFGQNYVTHDVIPGVKSIVTNPNYSNGAVKMDKIRDLIGV